MGVEQGKRGNSLHSLGRVCQSAWAKNGALVRVAGHQTLLLLLVSISSLEQSSQSQTLSWALPAPASFRSLCLSLTHSPPPSMLSASYTQLSPLLPSSPLVYFFLFCAPSQPSPPPPRPFSSLVPSPPFPAVYHSLYLCVSLSFPPFTPPHQAQQEPFVSRSSAGGSRNLLLPTPQHTPSLAGLATARPLSHTITPASTVTAKPSASAVP